jgi:hypothetical protein
VIDGYKVTVYMDQRDVTSWVNRVQISAVDSMTRKFTIDFSSWHSFDVSSRWDIFESYDPTNPRQECTIRAGVIDPSRRKMVSVSKGSVPRVTVQGYEWAWLAQRKRPTSTIIVVPTSTDPNADVKAAINNYNKSNGGDPIGEYSVWHSMNSNHDVIRRLMQSAGMRSTIRIPKISVSPFVIPPKNSYFRQAKTMAEIFSAVIVYQRSTNTMQFLDPKDISMGASNLIEIPGEIVSNFSAQPKFRSRPTRVIMRFPPWH